MTLQIHGTFLYASLCSLWHWLTICESLNDAVSVILFFDLLFYFCFLQILTTYKRLGILKVFCDLNTKTPQTAIFCAVIFVRRTKHRDYFLSRPSGAGALLAEARIPTHRLLPQEHMSRVLTFIKTYALRIFFSICNLSPVITGRVGERGDSWHTFHVGVMALLPTYPSSQLAPLSPNQCIWHRYRRTYVCTADEWGNILIYKMLF
jgi:hypothetical protein